jgi:hypothetical protein
MADIATVVVNATDARRAARFWATALGYVPRPDNPLILVPPDGAGPAIQVDETDRMHLDLRTASAEEQRAEIDRLIAAGATRVDWTYPENASFVVLADSEGNLFCVVNTGPDGP